MCKFVLGSYSHTETHSHARTHRIQFTKLTLYKASKHTRNAPCPSLGIQAWCMNTRSMLQAITGSWWTFCTPAGTCPDFGTPPVSKRSTKSCRFDSHLVGSPISRTAENEIRYVKPLDNCEQIHH